MRRAALDSGHSRYGSLAIRVARYTWRVYYGAGSFGIPPRCYAFPGFRCPTVTEPPSPPHPTVDPPHPQKSHII